jgi:hypothetical protein
MRHLITLAWLAAAIGCYAASMQGAAFGLMALGVIFEVFFWTRMFRGQRRAHGAARGD